MVTEHVVISLLADLIKKQSIVVNQVVEDKTIEIKKPTLEDLTKGIVSVSDNGTVRHYKVSCSEENIEKIYTIKQIYD